MRRRAHRWMRSVKRFGHSADAGWDAGTTPHSHAEFLMRGRDPGGIIVTILIGIAGSFIGTSTVLIILRPATTHLAVRRSPPTSAMLLGLRTVVYKVPDLALARAWYARVFGLAPYFDEPFYVGFDVGGFELGLDPDVGTQGAGPGGAVAYWGVANLADALTRAAERGAVVAEPLREVGGGILVAALRDPFGNVVGLIENPHFAAPPAAPATG